MARPALPRPGLRWRRAMLALAASGCAPVMHRDPATWFAARRAPIAEVVVGRADTVHGHLVEPVRIRATNGLTVEMLVKRPIPAPGSTVRAPLVLLLGGHHAGREAANYIPDTQGYAVAALSYPYDGPHRLSALGALRAAPSIRRALLDTPAAIRLALDWLLTEPWVDATRVEGVGASLGVPFMTAAAAVDRRITRLWAVHGAGDLYALLAHNMRPLVRTRPLRAAAVEVAYRVGAGDALAPERWIARVSPRPFVMINATDDERIPRAAVLALYDAAREPKTLVWLPGRHVQRNRPEVTRALVAAVLERMGKAE